jgi:glycosyltransferase involved in cell wall biosynthesis
VHVTLAGGFGLDTGRAAMHVYLALGLHRAGVRVSLQPDRADLRGCPPEFVEIYARSGPAADGPVVRSCWNGARLPADPGRTTFVRAMYEASGLPRGWADVLNQTRAVLVPSTFVADTFGASGVTVPVHVTPDGVDPEVYRYAPPQHRDGVTTLIVAGLWDPTTIDDRKHVPAAVRAWQRAFDGDPAARLVLKIRWPASSGGPPLAALGVAGDPRVLLADDVEYTRGIAHWYEQADVLLALGSEGFGLPLIEGMAVGRPVIALASEGQKDVCDQAGDLLLAVRPAGYEPHYHYGRELCGVRAFPDVAEVAACLRWVAEHRDEAAAMGRAASAWVHRYRSVWDYGPAVLAVLEAAGG